MECANIWNKSHLADSAMCNVSKNLVWCQQWTLNACAHLSQVFHSLTLLYHFCVPSVPFYEHFYHLLHWLPLLAEWLPHYSYIYRIIHIPWFVMALRIHLPHRWMNSVFMRGRMEGDWNDLPLRFHTFLFFVSFLFRSLTMDMFHCNTASLHGFLIYLKTLIQYHNPAIICLQETRMVLWQS
jgi:hypothetical protein